MASIDELLVVLEEHKFDTLGFQNFAEGNLKASDPLQEYKFEILVESQRGAKLFGIPLFSGRSLLPVVDPPENLRLNGQAVLLPNGSKENYPLPGLDWLWSWRLWHVMMLHDVDEAGWTYRLFWRPGAKAHGKYYFGDFVRRRLWIRMRQRTKL